ncbi:MAG: hypothetical protein QM485_04035 [Flavobacteriaceae bacterium]
MRSGDKFNAAFIYQHNKVNLPVGDFSANVFISQLSYSFKPNIYIQSLVQNNTVNKLWAFNLRFGWLQQANTGLFVVYNHTLQDDNPLNNSFIIKYTRIFDLVK